jgi:hypothetical protein
MNNFTDGNVLLNGEAYYLKIETGTKLIKLYNSYKVKKYLKN